MRGGDIEARSRRINCLLIMQEGLQKEIESRPAAAANEGGACCLSGMKYSSYNPDMCHSKLLYAIPVPCSRPHTERNRGRGAASDSV